SIVTYGDFCRHRSKFLDHSMYKVSNRRISRLNALLRSLQRVDRTRRPFLGQLIRIRLAIVVIGLVLHPYVHVDSMGQHGKYRKFMIALLTKDTVTFDCSHSRKTPCLINLVLVELNLVARLHFDHAGLARARGAPTPWTANKGASIHRGPI